jgi:hypothetical protein
MGACRRIVRGDIRGGTRENPPRISLRSMRATPPRFFAGPCSPVLARIIQCLISFCRLPHRLPDTRGIMCGTRGALGVPSVLPISDMAKIPINDPKHWRERAEKARAVAGEMTDRDAKRKMLRIAQDYEELARRAERRLRASKNSR